MKWTLVTSEPIETESDILQVVDDYRARGEIEEFFKALKIQHAEPAPASRPGTSEPVTSCN